MQPNDSIANPRELTLPPDVVDALLALGRPSVVSTYLAIVAYPDAPTSMSAIAARAGISAQTATLGVRALERAGLIRTRINPGSASSYFPLTPPAAQ